MESYCCLLWLLWSSHFCISYMCVCHACVHACKCAKLLQLCPTLWDPQPVARQAPLSMGFSRQEYWSGLPLPPPGDLPEPGIEHASLMSQRRQWHPTVVLLPGKSHGCRSRVGCSPWGREESDMTEWLHFHFSLSCIGEGNGNPLQCSCLENPGMVEPGGLPSKGWHRIGHDWSDLAAAAAALMSPALAGRFFTTSTTWEGHKSAYTFLKTSK